MLSNLMIYSYIFRESSDDEPSNSSGTRRGRGRSRRDADGAAVDACSRSPHHQAWKTEADPDNGKPNPPRFAPNAPLVPNALSPSAP